jgi:hypothetical protein
MTNEYNIYEFVSEGKRIYVLYDTDNDDTGGIPNHRICLLPR